MGGGGGEATGARGAGGSGRADGLGAGAGAVRRGVAAAVCIGATRAGGRSCFMVSTIRLNSVWPTSSAFCRSSGVNPRCSACARVADVLPSAVSAPLFVWRSNSAAIANQAIAIVASLSAASPRS